MVAMAVAGGIAIGVPMGMRLTGAGDLIDIETSPDRKERIELYRPNRWQRSTGHDSGDHAVARLASAADGATLAVSPPFYLDGAGTTRWSAQGVAIGVAVRYDRATGQWRVP
ncbi:hypothetical protein QLH51_04800 [Sphingomonas sp. 2R-10]|nr:hypothetical protein [Sphingomonas sp. 2R-10]